MERQDKYGWSDFDEDDSTDAIPDKYVLMICTLDDEGLTDEEVAVMVHRTCEGRYPLDGPEAERKRVIAQRLVDILNTYGL